MEDRIKQLEKEVEELKEKVEDYQTWMTFVVKDIMTHLRSKDDNSFLESIDTMIQEHL